MFFINLFWVIVALMLLAFHSIYLFIYRKRPFKNKYFQKYDKWLKSGHWSFYVITYGGFIILFVLWFITT